MATRPSHPSGRASRRGSAAPANEADVVISRGPNRKRRVLLSAYACDPYRGSEDGVGWGWIRAIAQTNDVHVITADFQRAAVERWQAENPADQASVTFHYVTPRWFHYMPTKQWRLIESTLLKPIMNLAYAQWLRDAARLASSLDDKHDFDLIHLVTYVGYRFPGRYYKLGKPTVWGPIGGLENTPWRFLPGLGLGGCLYYAARNVVNSLQKRLLPSPRHAFKHAAGGVIAATLGNAREIQRFYGTGSVVIPEIGVPGPIAAAPSSREPGEPLQIAWSGEHLPGKALPFLLHALAQLDQNAGAQAAGPQDNALDWRLTVLGHGRSTRKWKSLADKLGLSDRIYWTGWIDRTEALVHMRSVQLFVITSLKDLTSTVLLEALSQGLPVICPDHCGFSNVVDPTCGIKVPLESPAQLTEGLVQAITHLTANEDVRRTLAKGALERASAFSWEAKATCIAAVYHRVALLRSAPTSQGVSS